MRYAEKRVYVGRATLLAALLIAVAAPACGDDPAAESPATAGKGGKGGSGGRGGTLSNAGSETTGGASGEGGSGQVGGGDNGGTGTVPMNNAGMPNNVAGTDGDGGAGGGAPMLQVCAACEAKCKDWQSSGLGTDNCLKGTGVAQGGSAEGFELSLLCAELLDCMVRTSCPGTDSSTGDVTACYCGTAGTGCATGAANGPCRAEIEAAAESDAYADIGARFGDPAYALGRAAIVSDCYKAECPGQCFL